MNTKILFPKLARKMVNSEAKTSFLTTSWQSNKLLDPINDREEMTK